LLGADLFALSVELVFSADPGGLVGHEEAGEERIVVEHRRRRRMEVWAAGFQMADASRGEGVE
jgi:hypothetical protein